MAVANVYCTHAALYDYGLPRGFLVNVGRAVASWYAASADLDGHGFGDSATRTPVLFRAESGGTLPVELSAGTVYYAEAITDSVFAVYAAATGGSALTFASPRGTNVVVSVVRNSDKIREFYSRWIDTFLPAHAVPMEDPIPPLIEGLCAQLSARAMLLAEGEQSGGIDELERAAKAQIERFASGLVVRDARATASTNTAITSPVKTGGRGWVPALRSGVEVIP